LLPLFSGVVVVVVVALYQVDCYIGAAADISIMVPVSHHVVSVEIFA
jgi:hypothetical protein